MVLKAKVRLNDISKEKNLRDYYDELNDELMTYDRVINLKDAITNIEAAFHHLPKNKVTKAQKIIQRAKELIESTKKEENINAINTCRNFVEMHSSLKDGNDSFKRTESTFSQGQDQLKIINLQPNAQILQERRDKLEQIKQTSAQIKEMTDGIREDVYTQEHLLNDIENHIVETKKNASDAKDEIQKASDSQKGNRKKIVCLSLFILFVGLSIVALILFMVFGKKENTTK